MTLLSDTERAEYFAEQVVAVELAGDFAKGLLDLAQFFGGEFASFGDLECIGGCAQVFAGALERGDMAGAGGEGAVMTVGFSCATLQFVDQ